MRKQSDKSNRSQNSKQVAGLAEEALEAFQKENPEAFKELLKMFEGKSADVALLGHGKFHVSVQKGKVSIQPDVIKGEASTGRGAISPETLMAILEGKLTVLEAFHKGDLIARADSADLHMVYDCFVEFSVAALRSKQLQGTLTKFRKVCNL